MRNKKKADDNIQAFAVELARFSSVAFCVPGKPVQLDHFPDAPSKITAFFHLEVFSVRTL